MRPTTPRTTTRRAGVAVLATAAAGLGALTLPAVSSAGCVDDQGNPCPPPATVKARGTVGVNPATTLGVRPVPRQNARQIRQLRNGARVGIVCQTLGSRVSGTYGTTRLWNRLINGGYVSDAYVYTGKDGRVAPKC
jgi:hypothetical protein